MPRSFTPIAVDSQSKAPVPTPVSLVRYLEDPDFEHEDFSLSSAVTLRARVQFTLLYIVALRK